MFRICVSLAWTFRTFVQGFPIPQIIWPLLNTNRNWILWVLFYFFPCFAEAVNALPSYRPAPPSQEDLPALPCPRRVPDGVFLKLVDGLRTWLHEDPQGWLHQTSLLFPSSNQNSSNTKLILTQNYRKKCYKMTKSRFPWIGVACFV